MEDVKISNYELRNLQTAVRKKYKEKLNISDSEVVWNSNPENFEVLSTTINKVVGSTVSKRFLRTFFYDTQNSEKDTFRLFNINPLYLFAYGKSRSDYLAREPSALVQPKKRILYYINENHRRGPDEYEIITKIKEVGSLTAEEENQIRTAPHLTIIQEVLQIYPEAECVNICAETISIEEMTNQAEDEDEIIHFAITEDFIMHKKSADWLLYMLSDNLMRSLIDLHIFFHFHQQIKKQEESTPDIFTMRGRIEYMKKWREKTEKFVALFNDINDKEIEEIKNRELQKIEPFSRSSYFLALKALAEIHSKFWRANISNVDFYKTITPTDFQPFISEIRSLKPYYINKILQDIASIKSEKNYSYLCVEGYEDSFSLSSRAGMLNYFFRFNTLVREKNIKAVRIFTIPAKIKNGALESIWKKEQNEILFQYLHTNCENGIGTYLFMYDSEKISPTNYLLLYQSYAIRMTEISGIGNNDEFVDTIKCNDIMIEHLENEKTKVSSYMAYPQKQNGINQVIKIKAKGDCIRLFEDFKHRMTFANYSTDENISLEKLSGSLELKNKKFYSRFGFSSDAEVENLFKKLKNELCEIKLRNERVLKANSPEA